jgi:putative pyruvate formate lyase activating enzyme
MFAPWRSTGPDSGRFMVDPFEPAYLALHRSGQIAHRVTAALRELADCCACPRDCHINRMNGERRVCQTGRHARVSSAFAHFGEEDCIRGTRGSGTIFFGFCNLHCVFCQNWDISQNASGRECRAEVLAEVMVELQDRGCHNINFVTPEHVAPQVIEAIALAVPRGLNVPIVYNTSAYDALSSLKLLDGLVDIYMPDFKFWESATARRLAKAKDYPERAREAILEMARQVGPLRFGPDGVARRGLLVRHLVMPGLLNESAAIFQWLANEISPDTYVNIMDQYRPEYEVGRAASKYGDLARRPRSGEIERVYATAKAAGLWRFDERRMVGPA